MSPDGLLDLWFEDGTQETWLVEYKCPYKTRNRTDATLTKHMYPNSKIPDSTMLPRAPIPKYYYCQINWGMALLKLPKCFFVVWSPAPWMERQSPSANPGGQKDRGKHCRDTIRKHRNCQGGL